MKDIKKKKKDYEIIKGSRNVQAFKFEELTPNGFNSSGYLKENNSSDKNSVGNTQENLTQNMEEGFKPINIVDKSQSKVDNVTVSDKTNKNNKLNKESINIPDRIITNKVWNELKKSSYEDYKKISEEDKDELVKSLFGTDKERNKICYSCGREMDKRYTQFFSKKGNDCIYFCETCMYNLNKCINCGTPVVSNIPYQKLCRYCKPNLICDSCGNEYPNNKVLSNVPNVKSVFCKNCIEKRVKCWCCQRPLSKGEFINVKDGRKICSYCNTNILKTKNSILEASRNTIDFINMSFGIKGKLGYSIAVTNDFRKIKALKGNMSYCNCKYHLKDGKLFLLVPIGIREDHFIGFTAEEYSKIIAPKLNSKLNDKTLKSDFAFWVKHLVLRHKGYNEGFFLMKDTLKEKSRFFKWMNTNGSSKGVKTVFDLIKEDKFNYK